MPKYRAGTDATTAPSAWGDAEPYYFGNQMPPKDLFKPLPEGENLFQEGQVNGFSENVVLSGYRHNGQPLSYIKKGTFPKAGSAQAHGPWGGVWTEGGTTDYKIYRENEEIKIVCGDTTESLKNTDFPNINKIPSKLGILLVGGGGGSGGYTWYDPDKNGKSSDQYIVSGSGGGGGAILWGVLHLDMTNSTKYFIVKVGNGGAAGPNAGRSDLSHKNPKYGTNGTDGIATSLYLHDPDLTTQDQIIASAGGGKGGSRGSYQNDVAGGDGGLAVNEKLNSNFTYIGGKKGGKGCDCTTSTIPMAPAWEVTVKFADTEDLSYITTINHEAVSAIMQGGVNTDDAAHKVPGGASYDVGSTSVDGAGGSDTTNDFNTEVYGRGGAGGSWYQINERGAPGCFLLFY